MTVSTFSIGTQVIRYPFHASQGELAPFYPTVFYSMRRRDPLYTGKCCRVIDTTTNVETDIPFDGAGWCDAGVLAAASTPGNELRMTKWYAQKGGVDLIETDISHMPLMVNISGVVQTMDGYPCLKIDDGNRRIKAVSDAVFGLGSSAPFTVEVFANSSILLSTHFNTLVDLRAGTGASSHFMGVSGVFNIAYYNGVFISDTGGMTLSAATTYHYAWSYDATNLEQYVDGARQSIDAISVGGGTSRPLIVGSSQENNGSIFTGFIGEIAITKGTGKFTGGSFTARTYT